MIRGSPRVALWGGAFLGIVGAAAAEPTRLYQYNFNNPRPGGGTPFTFAYRAPTYQYPFRYVNPGTPSDPGTPQGPFDYVQPVPVLNPFTPMLEAKTKMVAMERGGEANPPFVWELRRSGVPDPRPGDNQLRRYVLMVNYQMSIYRVEISATGDELTRIVSSVMKCEGF